MLFLTRDITTLACQKYPNELYMMLCAYEKCPFFTLWLKLFLTLAWSYNTCYKFMKKEPWLRKFRYKWKMVSFCLMFDQIDSKWFHSFYNLLQELRIKIFMILGDGNIKIAFYFNIDIQFILKNFLCNSGIFFIKKQKVDNFLFKIISTSNLQLLFR